jgi:dihydroxyacetone kinase-like protein
MSAFIAAQAKSMLLSVASTVVAHREILCEADRHIGDGDHGISMANGFEAAAKELESHEYNDVYQVFSTVGRTLIRVMGGASGIIFGFLFYAGTRNMPAKAEINETEFTAIFEKALAEIQAKGQAKPGDKTLVDGLAPAVQAMRDSLARGDALPELLKAACQAAEAGMEASKQYIARVGKAKTVGERSVGYPDAGCVSLVLITRAMSDWAHQNLQMKEGGLLLP